MANPPNKSGNGNPPNGSPFVDVVTGQPFVPKTQAQQDAEHNLATIGSWVQDVFSRTPNRADAMAQTSVANPHAAFFQAEAERLESLRQFRQAKEYGRQVQSGVNDSALASRVNGLRHDPGIIGQGFQRASVNSYEDVYSARAGHESEAERIRGRMSRIAQSPEPNGQKLRALGMQLEYNARGMATADIAMAEMDRSGRGPRGQYRGINEVMSTINARENSDAAGELARGKGGNSDAWADLQKTIRETADALKSLSKEFQEGTKTEKEYREAAGDLAKKYNGAVAVEQAGRAAGLNVSGKRDWGGIIDNATIGLNAVGKVANYSLTAMEQKADIGIGFAGMANQQFGDQQAAFGGDMAAFRRAFGGSYGRAGREGTLRYGIKQGANVANTLGSAGGVVGSLESGSISGAADGAANTVMGTADIAMGLSAGAKSLRGAQQTIEMENAINMVSDTTAQKAFSTLTGINRASRGLGRDRGYVNAMVGSGRMVSDMAGMGIGQEQLAALTGQAGAGLGAQFGKDPMLLQQAGRAQLGGLMSAEQFIGNTSTLSGAGGGSKDLESIMASAVAAGMGNAKNINEMVAATRELASRSAGAGINAATGAAELVSKGVQSLSNLPENMRTGVAANAINTINDLSKDKSLNLYTVSNFSNLKRNFRGANMSELTAMSQLTPDQIAQFASGDTAAIHNAGMDRLLLDKNGKVNTGAVERLARTNRENIINQVSTMGSMTDEATRKSLTRYKNSGNASDLSPEAQQFITQQSLAKYNISGDAVTGVLASGKARQDTTTDTKGTPIDKADIANAVAASKIFDKGLANFGGQFDKFAATMAKMAEVWPVNEKAAAQMQSSFKTFDESAGVFKGAVDDLVTFLSNNGAWSGGGSSGNSDIKNGTGNNQPGSN